MHRLTKKQRKGQKYRRRRITKRLHWKKLTRKNKAVGFELQSELEDHGRAQIANQLSAEGAENRTQNLPMCE
jgi:hypothetical protein